MGCAGSKKEGSRASSRKRRMSRFSAPSHLSDADQKLVAALQGLKAQMDRDQGSMEVFSFTKIILKLGTIERVLKRIKAVFRSVDHGNKGHVTREELKEGLHKAKVDLGDEWQDADIMECLDHLGGMESEHVEGIDRIGLREFVVMLAVGRVCRALRRRSTMFVPLHGMDRSADPMGNPGGNSNGRPRVMRTIAEDKDEQRKSTIASGDKESDLANPARAVIAGLTTTTATSVSSDGPNGGDGVPVDEEGQSNGGKVYASAREAAEAAAITDGGETGSKAGEGPRGLPTTSSWRNIKWARIPSLKQLDMSGRSTRSNATTGSARPKKAEAASASRISAPEAVVADSVKYVLDLFIAAYFQFDTTAQGYITKSTVEKTLRQSERETTASTEFLDERRWHELAWDGDRLSFQEFMFAFAQWLGLMEDDDDVASIWSQSQGRSRPMSRAVSGDAAGAAAAAAAAAAAGTSASGAIIVDQRAAAADAGVAGDYGEELDREDSASVASESSQEAFVVSGAYSEFDASGNLCARYGAAGPTLSGSVPGEMVSIPTPTFSERFGVQQKNPTLEAINDRRKADTPYAVFPVAAESSTAPALPRVDVTKEILEGGRLPKQPQDLLLPPPRPKSRDSSQNVA